MLADMHMQIEVARALLYKCSGPSTLSGSND